MQGANVQRDAGAGDLARRHARRLLDELGVARGAEADVVREEHRALDVAVAVDGVDAVDDRDPEAGRQRLALEAGRSSRPRWPDRSAWGASRAPDSTEPMKKLADLVGRPVSAVLSAWVICPIFSSSVICASSASTSGAGAPVLRAAGTSAAIGCGVAPGRGTQATGASAVAAAAPRKLRRVGGRGEPVDGRGEPRGRSSRSADTAAV